MFVCVLVIMHRQTDRKTDRQTDRQTETERESERERVTERLAKKRMTWCKVVKKLHCIIKLLHVKFK